MSFNDEKLQKIWEKGTVASPNDPNVWRQDQCGAWIHKATYGDNARNSEYGWEVDHIDHNADNNALENLRPLQWKNNLDRGDGDLKCNVKANGTHNTG
jgi:hypothetical protein